MIFSSTEYIFLFLPCSIALYFWLCRWRLVLAAKTWLVAGSLFFYAYWKLAYLPILLASIFFNYAVGRTLGNNKSETADFPDLIKKRTILVFGILANLCLLGYFKYMDFFIRNLNALAGSDFNLLYLALPLGISFFTFQQVSYLVDSYRGETQEYNFINYSLFVSFFPQLIAGPIVHHAKMMPQFASTRNLIFNWDNAARGMFIFVVGLFKKVILADNLSVYANMVFSSEAEYSFLEAWVGTLSYTLQLYFDFSGYSEMAIGAALMLNIRLPINFNSPLKATNIQEFWNRWHMTMTGWFREYVYMPLSIIFYRYFMPPLSRVGLNPGTINVLITVTLTLILFTLIGFWHKGRWLMVFFGLFNGVCISVYIVWKRWGFRLPPVLAWGITFAAFNVASVFFRAPDFKRASELLSYMAGQSYLNLPQFVAINLPESLVGSIKTELPQAFVYASGWLALALSIILFLPNTLCFSRYIASETRAILYSRKNGFVVGVLAGIALLTVLAVQPQEFLYFDF